MASALHKLGIRKGDTVAVLALNTPPTLESVSFNFSNLVQNSLN